MRLSLPRLKELRSGAGIFTLPRETLIFYGIVLLASLLGLLLAADGYLFYISQLKAESPVPRLSSAPTLSAVEIDEVIRLLNERERKMQKLLGEEL